MRIALFSDIHGNNIALNAVLDDIQSKGGVDAIWILGDLAAFGQAPVKTLERLAGLTATTQISGNTDRFLLTGDQPFPNPEQVKQNPNLINIYTEVTRSLAWTQGTLATNGWLTWIEKLPQTVRTMLPDGTRVLLVHASPGHDDGPALYPNLSEAVLRERFTGNEADLIIVGHTHWTMEAHIDGVHVVNVGSVSNPFPPDLRASWVRLDSGPDGHTLTYHRVLYNHQAVIDELERLKHPGRFFLRKQLLGELEPSWHKF